MQLWPCIGMAYIVIEHGKKVLVRHLLHMTSGLGDYDGGNYSTDQFAQPVGDLS